MFEQDQAAVTGKYRQNMEKILKYRKKYEKNLIIHIDKIVLICYAVM